MCMYMYIYIFLGVAAPTNGLPPLGEIGTASQGAENGPAVNMAQCFVKPANKNL